MPSLDTDSFLKITCDWQDTCNRFFPTTKQIIDDSIFSVTDYCWVYLGVRMFCIRVVIVMFSSVLAWMYAVIERVIANHNMWHIFSTTNVVASAVLLSVILVTWAFKGSESNGHLNPVYWWLHTRVYCPLRQGTEIHYVHSRYLAVIFSWNNIWK